jgi:hypothetical protein
MKWKWTIPFHIIAGFITVLAGICISWWLAGLLFLGFLIFEIWTKKEWATSQKDFWEFVLAIFITTAILLLAIAVVALIKFIF